MNEIKIILDTDLQSDCDDVGALAVLHALADDGECEILAINVCSTAPFVAPCARAINRYYGRPNLPVGRISLPSGTLQPYSDHYSEAISRAFLDGAQLTLPVPNAVDVYRQQLSHQPDGSVMIVAIGFLQNLAQLLESPADAVSPLDGQGLVRQKVRELVVMGGRFDPPGRDDFNWKMDEDFGAARRLLQQWPTPITATDCELGRRVITGERLRTETSPSHVVRQAYELWFQGQGSLARPSWDQTAVLYAVRGLGDHFAVSPPGRFDLDETGLSRWLAQPDRSHRYLKLAGDGARVADEIEALMVRTPR
jgi:inosine-uridine nucleoside N-ribohydrolase